MSELLQGQMFPDDADGSTSSPEGFRVRTSPLPGRATDSTVIGRRSSLRSPDLLARSDQIGSSLRTCLRSASEAAIGCSLNWTDSGTPGGRAWWVLGRSGRRTSGTGCGSSGDGWPTPRTLTGGPESAERKQELGRTESGGGDLTSLVQAQNWPTAQNYAKGNQIIPPLAVQASWPTASARDWRSESCSQEFQDERNAQTRGKTLPWVVSNSAGPPAPEKSSTTGKRRDWSTPEAAQGLGGHLSRGGKRKGELLLAGQAKGDRTTPGALNPAWVCQLQGLPDGWLDLPDAVLSRLSATRTPRTSRTSSGDG